MVVDLSNSERRSNFRGYEARCVSVGHVEGSSGARTLTE